MLTSEGKLRSVTHTHARPPSSSPRHTRPARLAPTSHLPSLCRALSRRFAVSGVVPQTRRSPVALSAATLLVGVAYTLVPLWAAPDAWERASGPFQVVFAAMLALTGPAIGFFMADSRRL